MYTRASDGIVSVALSISQLYFFQSLLSFSRPCSHKRPASPTKRPAIERARGTVCQNGCAEERRDVRWMQHVERGCYCCHSLGGLLVEAAGLVCLGCCFFLRFKLSIRLYNVGSLLQVIR